MRRTALVRRRRAVRVTRQRPQRSGKPMVRPAPSGTALQRRRFLANIARLAGTSSRPVGWVLFCCCLLSRRRWQLTGLSSTPGWPMYRSPVAWQPPTRRGRPPPSLAFGLTPGLDRTVQQVLRARSRPFSTDSRPIHRARSRAPGRAVDAGPLAGVCKRGVVGSRRRPYDR